MNGAGAATPQAAPGEAGADAAAADASRAGRVSGCTGRNVTVDLVWVDKRRQWRRAGKLWHNAAIRTALQILFSPVRALARHRNPAVDPARR